MSNHKELLKEMLCKMVEPANDTWIRFTDVDRLKLIDALNQVGPQIESLTKERELLKSAERGSKNFSSIMNDRVKKLEAENAELKLRGNISCTKCGAIYPNPHTVQCNL